LRGSTVCVQSDAGKAFCALGAAKDPRCVGIYNEICNGKTVVRCDGGFAISERDCPVACVPFDFQTTLCTLSVTRDPVCLERCYGYCDAAGLVNCRAGYGVL
jgi:hypothetical protein